MKSISKLGLVFILLLPNVAFSQEVPEFSHDAIIFRDPLTTYGYTIYAQVGSLRLAQKLGLEAGDIILKGKGPEESQKIIQKVIDLMGGGGSILFKSGGYDVGSGIKIFLPSNFTIEGERYRFGASKLVSSGNPPLIFEKKDQKATIPSILQIKNIAFKVYNYKGKALLEIPEELENAVFEGVVIEEYNTSSASGFLIKGKEGVKIIEYSEVSTRRNIAYDFEATFFTSICPEEYDHDECGSKFGPGGLLIGGHHGFCWNIEGKAKENQNVPAVNTYPIHSPDKKYSDEEWRSSYPTTVIGLGYENNSGLGYRADGAFLILINASRCGGKHYEEINGGKAIVIGVGEE